MKLVVLLYMMETEIQHIFRTLKQFSDRIFETQTVQVTSNFNYTNSGNTALLKDVMNLDVRLFV
ncbi:3025_t:CDS:2 [Cetraspora pellucida]|uniref:3025_t:CDS:1 n=1 Tax=Cetraspora pellucida TaxID=1433469 RepID=A0A9N8VIS2_9GLOM|nr:3025_t:CDS:2 [Cetraspora pellucida]